MTTKAGPNGLALATSPVDASLYLKDKPSYRRIMRMVKSYHPRSHMYGKYIREVATLADKVRSPIAKTKCLSRLSYIVEGGGKT
jgi:hypothetical protein